MGREWEGRAPVAYSQVVPSRVNDGVCDCCDGSDEWATPGATSRYVMLSLCRSGASTNGVTDLCADTCAEAAAEVAAAQAACEDEHVKCGVWARKGECRRNEEYMGASCRRACGLCDGGAAAAGGGGGSLATVGDDEGELPRQVVPLPEPVYFEQILAGWRVT